MRPTVIVLLISGFVLAAACATTRAPPGQLLVSRKCGACHLRPTPGATARSKLRRILEDHRRRFSLTGEQAGQILERLAAPGSPAARP